MPNSLSMCEFDFSRLLRISWVFADMEIAILANITDIDQEARLLSQDRPTRLSLGFLEELRESRVRILEQKDKCQSFIDLLSRSLTMSGIDRDEVC